MLYHISLRFWEYIEKFYPRIPKGRLDEIGENSTISRICLSDSIEGCFTGATWGGYNLVKDSPYKDTNFVAIARLYKFNKAEIQKENLLYPEEIREYVPDSNISREHWVINQEIVPNKSSIIILRDFHIETIAHEHKNGKCGICKIINPIYDMLNKEDEDVLVGFANSENKELFLDEHKKELFKILR